MTDEEKRQLALAAAFQAAAAAAELICYAREGADFPEPFGDAEVVEKLLDAAKMTIEIEKADIDLGDRGQVYGAIVKDIEGWA